MQLCCCHSRSSVHVPISTFDCRKQADDLPDLLSCVKGSSDSNNLRQCLSRRNGWSPESLLTGLRGDVKFLQECLLQVSIQFCSLLIHYQVSLPKACLVSNGTPLLLRASLSLGKVFKASKVTLNVLPLFEDGYPSLIGNGWLRDWLTGVYVLCSRNQKIHSQALGITGSLSRSSR